MNRLLSKSFDSSIKSFNTQPIKLIIAYTAKLLVKSIEFDVISTLRLSKLIPVPLNVSVDFGRFENSYTLSLN